MYFISFRSYPGAHLNYLSDINRFVFIGTVYNYHDIQLNFLALERQRKNQSELKLLGQQISDNVNI